MKALVTGTAGFIGSTLVDRLLADGNTVRGVDCFTPYYAAAAKHANLTSALDSDAFELVQVDLSEAPLSPLLDGIDVVFHLAGQPGVRASWGVGFGPYVSWNILATQRLLEAARESRITRFVNSSSSSVYGRAERFPTSEDDLPRPVSPYGVTKLGAEHLCTLFASEFDVPTVSLRYFTVYGPRQRPDMAMHRIIDASLGGPPFPLNGDGSNIRDFTYVDDAVQANVLAAAADAPRGSVFNIGGGTRTSVAEVIELVEDHGGSPVPVELLEAVAGDPPETGADTTRALATLGWHPAVAIADGIERQIEWHRKRAGG